MNHVPTEPPSNRTTVDASSREGFHFSLYLTPFKYLDFTEVFFTILTSARRESGCRKAFSHPLKELEEQERIWKNGSLWEGISLFLATPAQSSNLKTNLEKRTKKNSIYLQRMRGKSSLALYRSFQSITKKKKEESNLRQFSERPPPQTMTLWRAAWLRESTRAQPSLPDASTYLCAFSPGKHKASHWPSQSSHLTGCSANSQLKV